MRFQARLLKPVPEVFLTILNGVLSEAEVALKILAHPKITIEFYSWENFLPLIFLLQIYFFLQVFYFKIL